MSRRAEWQAVLEAEMTRWSAMSWEQLIAELHDHQEYEVQFESKRYQVEVAILENTSAYVHVSVAVDDGTLLRSIVPLSSSFIRQKTDSSSAAG